MNMEKENENILEIMIVIEVVLKKEEYVRSVKVQENYYKATVYMYDAVVKTIIIITILLLLILLTHMT